MIRSRGRLRRCVAGVAIAGAFGASLSAGNGDAKTAEGQRSEAAIDRTYSCASGFVGGVRQIEVHAHAGSRTGSEWQRLPYAVISSGGVARTPGIDAPPENSLAWITAGKPTVTTTIDDTWLSFTPRAGGTIGVNRDLCVPAQTRLVLAPHALGGGAVGAQVAGFECEAQRRVLVRIRATVDGGTALRERGRIFRVTNAVARSAKLSVGSAAGRVVAFADVDGSGRARLFTARACTAD